MSKFLCKCGHVIVDQTDFLPYKADYIKDKDFFAFFDACDEEIEKQLNNKGVSQNEQMTQQLSDNIYSHYLKYCHEILECSHCGRLWMQRNGENYFVSFLPESGKYEAILDKQ